MFFFDYNGVLSSYDGVCEEKENCKRNDESVAGVFVLNKCNMEMIMLMVQEINVKEKKDDDIIEEEKCNEDIQTEGGDTTVNDK